MKKGKRSSQDHGNCVHTVLLILNSVKLIIPCASKNVMSLHKLSFHNHGINLVSTPPDDSVDRVIHESVALNRSHDSLVNGGPDGYGHDESGAESDEAFSDWDSCEELVLVCHLY